MIDDNIHRQQGVRADELCEMVVITNERGLHARAAAKFVQLASHFEAEINVMMGDTRVGGGSIMGLMMLAASNGSRLKICASGSDAVEAMSALSDLVRRGFDEK